MDGWMDEWMDGWDDQTSIDMLFQVPGYIE